MDNGKYMFIIVGAPGSGKSTLARKLMEKSMKFIRPIAEMCEADDYWYIVGNGKYAFDQKSLWKAHQWCQNKASKLAENGSNFIVSNTGIKSKDRKFYFDLAAENGYRVVFIHQKKDYGSIHDVPRDKIERMKSSFAEPTQSEIELILKSDEMSDDMASLLAVCGINYEF